MSEPILIIVDKEETNYLHNIAPWLVEFKSKVFTGKVETLASVELVCKKFGIKKVITTREDFLKKLLPAGREKKATITNYEGSIIPIKDIEVLIIRPLKSLYTIKYQKFLTERFITKFSKPKLWAEVSDFQFKIIKDDKDAEELYSALDSGMLCGVDIETSPGMRITSVAYTIKYLSGHSNSFVVPVNGIRDIAIIRRSNGTKIPKVLQNGKYDSAYFHAYSAPLVGYFYDTVNMMHAWYSELPKDLATLAAFYIRDVMYWKDLADSGDSYEQLKYNALDTWATVEVACRWMEIAPDWAKRNYVDEFSVVPSCVQMEMTGVKRDIELLKIYNSEDSKKLTKKLMSIQKMAGRRVNLLDPSKGFNPSSPKQTLELMRILGDKKAESSDDKSVKASMLLHPLNERILGEINSYRSDRKELTTYLPYGFDAKGRDLSKEFRGRILYSINPHGTDTGRNGSRESAFSKLNSDEFNCGLQIQNITADGKVKDTFIADEGYEIYEADFRQAEARGVAYCSGDEALLEAVESPKDFHSLNASAFFGIPYHEIYQDEIAEHIDAETGLFVPYQKAKTILKDIRDLSKRVNHGANYNMGAAVLLDTMGEKKVREAQRLLDLPRNWTLIKICEYLLDTYQRTYPKVKTTYYNWIKSEIRNKNKLTGPTGWTRWCFGNPSGNKLDLNSYVAHYTQNLNAMILNKAVIKVWNKYYLDSDIKLLAQIHDSILFLAKQSDAGRRKAQDIADMMVFPVPVTDCMGKRREMIVPVDLKCNGYRWSGKTIDTTMLAKAA